MSCMFACSHRHALLVMHCLRNLRENVMAACTLAGVVLDGTSTWTGALDALGFRAPALPLWPRWTSEACTQMMILLRNARSKGSTHGMGLRGIPKACHCLLLGSTSTSQRGPK